MPMGLKVAITRVPTASRQPCRVHFMRNLLAHAGRRGRRPAAVIIGTHFAREEKTAAKAPWCKMTEQMRPRLPKLAAFIAEAEEDVLTPFGLLGSTALPCPQTHEAVNVVQTQQMPLIPRNR